MRWEISWRFFYVWLRNIKVWRRFWISNLLYNFIEPVLYLFALGFGVGRYVSGMGGLPYETFVASGIVASSAMFAATFEGTYGTYVRMVFQHTFDATIATPISPEEVTLGEIAYGATKAAVYGSLVVLVVGGLGLLPAWRWTFLLVPVAALLTGLVFGSAAVLVAATVPSIDAFNYYLTLGIMPMFFFSGIFFPLADLPAGIQAIAWFTPLMHSVRLARSLVLGPGPVVWVDFLWLAMVAVPLALLAVSRMRRKLMR